jgi:hypothetical protein
LTESNHFLDFDFKSYSPNSFAGRQKTSQRLRFFISSVAAKAEFIFRKEEGGRLQGEFRLNGGLATKAFQLVEATETTLMASDFARKVTRHLVNRNGFRDEKSFQWVGQNTVSIAEAPWVFEHAWDQLRRATSQNANPAVTVEFHDGSKVRKIAIVRSKTMNSEADVFLLTESVELEKRRLVLTFQGIRLSMFAIDVPVIGLVKFSLDER